MTESHGLDINKKSHPRLLILTNRMAWDTSRVAVDLHGAPRAPKLQDQSLRVNDTHNLVFQD
jgi:hypothetical protein